MVSSFLDDVIMGLECRIGMCQQCYIVDVSRPFFWIIDFSFCHDPGVIMKWFEHASVWPPLKWRFFRFS